MANKKTEVSVLVKGLGVGMAFLQALTEEIVAAGGFEEMIHFLTKESARPTCKKIAKMIVASDWKIPCSLIQRLVRESQRSDPRDMDEDSMYNWVYGVDLEGQFGIPVIYFGNKEGAELQTVPKVLVDQLAKKRDQYPLTLEWEGEKYVVVNRSGINDVLDGKTTLEEYDCQLGLSPAKYFNLEQ